ncbi:hypothetical protein SGLAD_v1c06450 [Spiroplasma gladiatoris]|uniref:Transmembrane protein n=1 Tax=Spiroplasma gladiatoris TaxID=2143 RepID=A0A4P7AHB5_9MOLU|nr:hypothetical protein [Spiroplasma gladiatoris]QBQ07844.1 hypothetical protein SGLAD_v1c06450 [Spiroplasma gladiatoris]
MSFIKKKLKQIHKIKTDTILNSLFLLSLSYTNNNNNLLINNERFLYNHLGKNELKIKESRVDLKIVINLEKLKKDWKRQNKQHKFNSNYIIQNYVSYEKEYDLNFNLFLKSIKTSNFLYNKNFIENKYVFIERVLYLDENHIIDKINSLYEANNTYSISSTSDRLVRELLIKKDHVIRIFWYEIDVDLTNKGIDYININFWTRNWKYLATCFLSVISLAISIWAIFMK